MNLHRKIIRPFTSHPESVGETYRDHFLFACCNGIKLTLAGLACIVHSIFPFLFPHTASDTIRKLNQEMLKRVTRSENK